MLWCLHQTYMSPSVRVYVYIHASYTHSFIHAHIHRAMETDINERAADKAKRRQKSYTHAYIHTYIHRAMETDINERAADKAKRRQKSDGLKNEGNKLFTEGEYKKAFKKYTQALEHDKSNKSVLTNRALCAIKLKNK